MPKLPRGLPIKILILLTEAANEAIDWFELLSSPYKRLDYFTTYHKGHFRDVLRKMEKIGEIEKVIKKGKPYFRLLSSGNKRLIKEIPIFKLRETKWDKKWRVVIFDIPENKRKIRNYLREKLKKLGLAMWQKSVYITPFDLCFELKAYLESLGLVEYAIPLEGKRLVVGDEKAFAYKVWRLEKLEKRYLGLIEKWQQNKNRAKLLGQYLEILPDDPFLPKELLPKNWAGSRVRKILLS